MRFALHLAKKIPGEAAGRGQSPHLPATHKDPH